MARTGLFRVAMLDTCIIDQIADQQLYLISPGETVQAAEHKREWLHAQIKRRTKWKIQCGTFYVD